MTSSKESENDRRCEPHAEDPTLMGFTLVTDPIRHQRFDAGLYRLAELHQTRKIYGEGGGILISGPSGVGKTVLVSSYMKKHKRNSSLDGTHIPVLCVTVPSAPTAKALAETILINLGYPKAHRGTESGKTFIIRDLFQRCSVEMLILDEFQHLFYAPNLGHFRSATDWLKVLIDETKVAIVACGLPEAQAVVNANEQLARRFAAHFPFSPFSIEDADDFREFRSVLKVLQTQIPLPFKTPLYEANMARRCQIASHGLLDYTRKVLEGAVSVASRAGRTEIGLDILAAGFRERVWAAVPDRLNPFHEQSYLRPLDRRGEVFYLHTHTDSTGSAIAKRLQPTGREARRL